MKKRALAIMFLVAVISVFTNGLMAEVEVATNVIFFPPINNPDSPVIRCVFCKRILGEEVEGWYPANDPDFKKYRLFQVCTECAATKYPKDYYMVIMKKKWTLIEYHIACMNDDLNQYWAKHAPGAGNPPPTLLARGLITGNSRPMIITKAKAVDK